MRFPPFGGFLAMLILAGCGGAAPAPASSAAPVASASAAAKPAGSASPAASAKPAASGPIKLKIPYTSPSGAYTPQWVGADQGIFLKHGFDVAVNYMDTNTVAPALLAGEIDATPTPSTLNIIISGGDAVFIANVLTAPVFSLYSANSVESVKALKGQVIGDSPQGSAPDSALRALLDKNGLNPATDVKYVFSPDPSTILAAMKANQAVAGILSAPSTLLGKDAGYKELANTGKEGVAGLHQVIAVRRSTLDQNRAMYAELLRAFRDAVDFAKSNPQPTKVIIGKYTKTEPGPALEEAYSAFQPYWQLAPVKASDVAAVLKFSSNPAAASFDPAKAIDNSIIDGLK